MATLEFLTRKLQSSDAEERREAAVDLGRTGREAIPLLLRTLSDADWRVRKTAVEALIALGGDDVIQGLIQCLSAHDNAGARNSAIEALVHLGGGAVDALLSVLETPDVDVRKFIVDILGDIGDTRAVPALIGKLDDPDENIRVAAAESLGKIRDRRAVEPLIACLTRYDQSWLDYAAPNPWARSATSAPSDRSSPRSGGAVCADRCWKPWARSGTSIRWRRLSRGSPTRSGSSGRFR